MNPVHTSTPSVTIDSPRAAIRALVRAFYDVQALRIQSGNRLFANFRAKLGLLPSEAESQLPDAYKELLAKIRELTTVTTDVVTSGAGEQMRREASVAARRQGESDQNLEDSGVDPEDAEELPDTDLSPGAKVEAKNKAKVGDLIMKLLFQALDDMSDPGGAKAAKGKAPKIPAIKKFQRTVLIPSFAEAALIEEYRSLRSQEAHLKANIEHALSEHPIWTEYLRQQIGCGPGISAVIISEFDITKSKYPSSMWAYAGFDVAPDGFGRSKRSEHLVDKQYINKDGKEATKKSITFSPFLKTKMYLWGSCIIRASGKKAQAKGTASPYFKVYSDYKNRLENHAIYGTHNDGKVDATQGVKETVYNSEHVAIGIQEAKGKRYITSKGRRHAMALRYMIKIVLRDLYIQWRTIENLPVAPDYATAKLGYVHGQGPVENAHIPTGQKEAMDLAQTLIDAGATATPAFRNLVGVIQARFGLRWVPAKNAFINPAGTAA